MTGYTVRYMGKEKDAIDESAVKPHGTKTGKKNRIDLKSRKLLVVLAALLVPILLVPSAFLLYAYTISPEAIRQPAFDHYHFRMQVVIDGQSENFGTEKYQQAYAKDQCSADLTENPIHFHDQKDQFVHIHWNGITGGLVMKEYGWDYLSGPSSVLGYRMDSLPLPKAVPTKGALLPAVPEGSNFYVYVGDEKGYVKKTFDEWKNQDLEQFFGKASNIPANDGTQSSWLERIIFPETTAHSGHEHSDDVETQEEKLTRINNLLGNVVIFVQKDEPTEDQIKERFNNLVPLSDSVCGG